MGRLESSYMAASYDSLNQLSSSEEEELDLDLEHVPSCLRCFPEEEELEFSDLDLDLEHIPSCLRCSPEPAPKRPKLRFGEPLPRLEFAARAPPDCVLGPEGGRWLQSLVLQRQRGSKEEEKEKEGERATASDLLPGKKAEDWSQMDGAVQAPSSPEASQWGEEELGGVLSQLRPYQMETIRWARRREACKEMPGGLVGHEQGCGKTIIMLCLMRHEVPNLVICPKTVMSAWREEAQKWFGDRLLITAMDCEACAGRHPPSLLQLQTSSLVLTTYESVLAGWKSLQESWQSELGGCGLVHDLPSWRKRTRQTCLRIQRSSRRKGGSAAMADLFALCWRRVVLDESQKIKGNGLTASAVCALPRRSSWLLSGTFMSNSIQDLYVCLRFLGRRLLPKKMVTWKQQLQREPQARAWMEHFMQTAFTRFTLQELGKRDPQMVLPPLQRWSYRLPFINPEERALYAQLASNLRKDVEGVMSLGASGVRGEELAQMKGNMLKQLMWMRRTAVGIGVVRSGFEDCRQPCYLERCTKMRMMCSYIAERVAPQEKVLIFCEWTTTLDLVESSLRLLKQEPGQPLHIQRLKWTRLDGSMNSQRRCSAKAVFTQKPEVRIFLISLFAGNTGSNFQAANHVLILAPWYNPQAEEQALSRAWRPGQQSSVNVVWLLVAGSCEEDIYALSRRKLALNDHVHNQRTIGRLQTQEQRLPSMRSAEGIHEVILQGSSRALAGLDSLQAPEQPPEDSSLLLQVELTQEPRVYEVATERQRALKVACSMKQATKGLALQLTAPLQAFLRAQGLAARLTLLQEEEACLIAAYSDSQAEICSSGQRPQSLYLARNSQAGLALDLYWLSRARHKALYSCSLPLCALHLPGSSEDLRKQLLEAEGMPPALASQLRLEGSLSSELLLQALRLLDPCADGVLFKQSARADMGLGISELCMVARSSKLQLRRLYHSDTERLHWSLALNLEQPLKLKNLPVGGLIPLGRGRGKGRGRPLLLLASKKSSCSGPAPMLSGG